MAILASDVGSSLLGGVVGGLTVLLGVLIAEALARSRARREQLQQALWDLQRATTGALSRPLDEVSADRASALYDEIIGCLGRIRYIARWPIRDADKIREEVDSVLVKLIVGVRKWAAESGPPPRLGPILSDELRRLILRGKPDARKSLFQKIDEALQEAGLPTVDDYMSDDPDWQPLNKS